MLNILCMDVQELIPYIYICIALLFHALVDTGYNKWTSSNWGLEEHVADGRAANSWDYHLVYHFL